MHRFPVCPAQLVRILPTVVSPSTDGDHTRAHTAKSRCVKRGRTEGLQQEGGQRKWEEKWDCMNFAAIKKTQQMCESQGKDIWILSLSLSL